MFTHDSRRTGALVPDLETALSRPSATLRVLVVDDDPATGRLLSLVGEKEGFQVVTIDDGRNAYRMLKSDANFAAAVFNMTMASLKGLDLVRHMKTEKRLMRIPVVIVAGDNGLQLISESFAAGALAFLPKPFTREKLTRTLRLAIGSQAVRKTADVRAGKLAA